MGRVVTFEGPKEVGVREYEDPALGPGEVRLRTLYSGISAGTEMTAYRGSNPYLNKRWEPERRLFVEGETTLEYPVEGWGYEEVGEVAEVGPGVTAVGPGEVVYGTWGHRSTTVVEEDWAAARVLPSGVDPLIGVFSRIGAIALNAVLDANVHLSEYVAVFGQGVPGLIVAQLARLNGGTVIAVDGVPKRLELARELGAAHVVDFTQESPAEEIKGLTEGRGADVCIEISGSYPALHEAIRSTAYNSKVVSAPRPAFSRGTEGDCSSARSSTTTVSGSRAPRSPALARRSTTAGASSASRRRLWRWPQRGRSRSSPLLRTCSRPTRRTGRSGFLTRGPPRARSCKPFSSSEEET
jgi:threonine dehydrogenase-like Zn-dependent dehydrogenase